MAPHTTAPGVRPAGVECVTGHAIRTKGSGGACFNSSCCECLAAAAVQQPDYRYRPTLLIQP